MVSADAVSSVILRLDIQMANTGYQVSVPAVGRHLVLRLRISGAILLLSSTPP
jgi:hypothetical protein